MSAKVSFENQADIFVENGIWRGETKELTLLLNEISVNEIEDNIFSQEPHIDFALAREMAKLLGGRAETLIPVLDTYEYPPDSDF